MKAVPLFSFPKGKPPNAFPVPPFAWESLGIGMCLVERPRPMLILTNEEHLLFLDPINKKKRTLISPLGHQQVCIRVAATTGLRGYTPPDEVYCCVACSDGTFGVLHPDGRERARFRARPPAPRYLANNTHQIAISSKGDLFVRRQGDDAVWRVSIPEGDAHLIAMSTQGLAQSADGQIWIASKETRHESPSVHLVQPLGSGQLVGVDGKGGVYWLIEEVVEVEPRSRQGTNRTWSWKRATDLLCTSLNGDLRYRVRLQGANAIFPPLRSGEAQIEAIAVSKRGEVYVFGFDYHRGTKVYLYKLIPS